MYLSHSSTVRTRAYTTAPSKPSRAIFGLTFPLSFTGPAVDTHADIHIRGRNRLLDLLPAADYDRLVPTLERVTARVGDIVCEREELIKQVDFPLGAVISVVVIMADGSIVEAGTAGNEGMGGLPLVLGSPRCPTQAYYQLPGEALRMSASAFKEELARRGALFEITRRYAHGFFVQVAQSAACNRVHPVERRLCRWILMSHDRVGTDRLQLTQEVMSQMLGVRRASVSVVASALQKQGFIRYSRGVLHVVDRSGLEGAACECYGVMRDHMERVLAADAA